MIKRMKGLSMCLLLALLVSLFAVSPGFAAQDARVEVESGRGAYIAITNVVKAEPDARLYIAEGPVTITFHGESLAWEDVEYFPGAQRFGNDLNLTGENEPVQFDVKRYTNPGETAVLDELITGPVDFPAYVTGNHLTVSKPGFYLVIAAPEAAAPTMLAVQVVAPAAEVPALIPAGAVTAVPTASKVLVDGAEVAFAAYQIGGNNYFKLRDLALVLSGTAKQFEVTWDAQKNAINVVTGQAYTEVGGELALSLAPFTHQIAIPTASKVYLNGEEVPFTAYTIGGNNYFKLRDIGKAMDFGITWNAATNSIEIGSRKGYTE